MIRFAENLNKMIAAGLGGALEAPRTEVAVGHCVRYLEASGAVASFESNIAAPIRSLRVDMQPIQAGSGDPSPDNVRPISGRESVTVWREALYDQSADPALTVQLGQTVYGGTLDVVSGKLTVTKVIVDLSTLTWINSGGYKIFRTTDLRGSIRTPSANSEVFTWQINSIGLTGRTYDAIGTTAAYSIAVNTTGMVYVTLDISSAYADVDAFTSAMSGAQLCYELATPLEITLDPATLSTLKGDNNVWSDAGDVTLEYPYYEETEGY